MQFWILKQDNKKKSKKENTKLPPPPMCWFRPTQEKKERERIIPRARKLEYKAKHFSLFLSMLSAKHLPTQPKTKNLSK